MVTRRYPILLLLSLVAAVLFMAAPAEAERRVALVVGNQQYAELPSLDKSAADAETYAALFKDKGFDQVILEENLTRNGMDEAIAEFMDAIHPGDTAVFVYAGHGWSDGRDNYLVPTDAPKSGSEDFLRRISLPVKNGATGILDEVEQKGAGLKVAIIDACRDNPFVASDGTRSIGITRGFNRMEAPPAGMFVVFSAGAGQTALDRLSDNDANPNGVFTRTFVPLLRANLTLLDATKEAQDKVYEAAKLVGHDQQPSFYDETRGNKACLSGACGDAPTAGASDDAAWQRIAVSTDPNDFEGFIRIFPTSPHVAEAQLKVTSLRQQLASLPRASGDVLEGSWDGSYAYDNSGSAAVHFAVHFDNVSPCRGQSMEPNTFGDAQAKELTAIFTCDAAGLTPGQTVELTKRYDGTGGVSHAVHYTGRLSPDGKTLSGTWAINGQIGGTFELQR